MRKRLSIVAFLIACGLGSGSPFAFEPNDWRGEQKGFNGKQWTCLSPACGSNAVAAYEPQLLSPIFTLLDYESYWKQRAKNPKGVPQAITNRGLFRRIRSSDESVGNLRHYTIIMRHRQTNGEINFVAVGYMARGLQGYELTSIAQTEEQADANLKLVADEVRQKFDPH